MLNIMNNSPAFFRNSEGCPFMKIYTKNLEKVDELRTG